MYSYKILPINGIAASMKAMDKWNTKYLGARFDSAEMRKLLIEATFYQAKIDGITILENEPHSMSKPGFCLCGLAPNYV